MDREVNLGGSGKPFYGTRFLGRGLRGQLEQILATDGDVRLNFANVGVTQSFLDEFLGVLVVRRGQPVVDRLILAGCTRETKALLELVIGGRLRDHEGLSSKARVSAYPVHKDLIRG